MNAIIPQTPQKINHNELNVQYASIDIVTVHAILEALNGVSIFRFLAS